MTLAGPRSSASEREGDREVAGVVGPFDARLVRAVVSVADALLFTRSLHPRLRGLCRTTVELLRCDRSSVFLVQGGALRAVANAGNPSDIAQGFPEFSIPLESALTVAISRRRQPLVINDARSSPYVPLDLVESARLVSLVVAPVWDQSGEMGGLFTAEHNEQRGRFSAVEADLVGALASLVSIAVALDRGSESAERRRGDTSPRHPDVASALSRQELALLDLIARGHTNAECAELLHLSVRTVEHHRSALLMKLDANSRADLVAAATDLGLVSFPSENDRE